MAKKTSFSFLFQSKFFCFSLFYLFASLIFALYVSLSRTNCNATSNDVYQIQRPLFWYPSTYGERKYAIPTVNSSCHFPLHFADYDVALKDIQDVCRDSSSSFSSNDLMYQRKQAECFAGNLSDEKRLSYFNLNEDQTEIPCGFMQEFPIRDPDRRAMEKCAEVVVVSAIFGDHDKIRQPRGLGSKTLQTACFFMFIDSSTLNALNSHKILLYQSGNDQIGVWKIVRVTGNLPYRNPAMNGVIPKHLIHRLFPNSKFSIWLDAKLQLIVDPLLLLHSLLIREKVDMAISKHPFHTHTLEEAVATARWKKWGDLQSLEIQMETFCKNGLQPWTPQKLPCTTDVPDTALIIRKHGVRSNHFSCLLFNELEAFNPRDQLAFAYVRDLMKPKIKINFFEVEVFEKITIEYRHNLQGNKNRMNVKEKLKLKKASKKHINGNWCEGYLMKIWGSSYD